MTEKTCNKYVKRTQKDYSMTFKLEVVAEVERGDLGIKSAARKYGIQSHSTVSNWLKKYGTFDQENHKLNNMCKSKDLQILELEQKLKLLEKQNNNLSKELKNSEKKAIFFDMMIDMAEKEFKIPIRKNSLPKQLIDSKANKKKA